MVIYKITNTVNGKVYIGKTVRSVKRRWQEHRRAAQRPNPVMYLSRAIKKHGVDAFKIEVVCTASTAEELNTLEKFYVLQYAAINPQRGYNETEGGDGGPSWKNRKHTIASRQKISQSCEGLIRSAETRQKISEFRKQFKYSAESKANISKSKSGLNHPLCRKNHSPETREKMRLSALARWQRQIAQS